MVRMDSWKAAEGKGWMDGNEKEKFVSAERKRKRLALPGLRTVTHSVPLRPGVGKEREKLACPLGNQSITTTARLGTIRVDRATHLLFLLAASEGGRVFLF